MLTLQKDDYGFLGRVGCSIEPVCFFSNEGEIIE
tara:strand:- start:311 stop:412 length:102 start_codon:yes stop_codon:yes gene_type:complete